MMKAKRKTFWIVSLFVALCACILCGCAGSADASFDVRDYFNIPTYVAETACVGEQTVIAGVTATEAKAEDYTITLYNPDGEKVEKDGFLFTPTQEGRYKCVYSYRLNGEYYEYSYDIHASIKDGPVFHNEPELPYAFLAGREYTLPTVTAKDYSTNANGVDVAVTLSVRYGTQDASVTNNVFTPEYNGEEATVVYQAISGTKTQTIEKSVPVLNAFGENYAVDVTKLFVSTDFESGKLTENGVSFTTRRDAELQYANYMVADGTELVFGFGEYDQAKAVTVKYQSVQNPHVYTTVRFEKGAKRAGAGKIVLNGKTEMAYDFQASEQLLLSYDHYKNRFVTSAGVELFKIATDANGAEFNGYPGNLVKVSFILEGVYGDCDFNVYKIASQDLAVSVDSISPYVYREKDRVEYYLGETITVKGAQVWDAIDPYASISVRVLYNNKTVVKDVNGIVLDGVNGREDITFKPTAQGMYVVLATVEDGSGNYNKLAIRSNLYVYDQNQPTIRVNGEISASVKVGDKVQFPEITATDEESASKVTLQLCVIWPNMKMLQIAVDDDNLGDCKITSDKYVSKYANGFTYDVEGTYRIRIVATDESGNYARVEYTVVCGG